MRIQPRFACVFVCLAISSTAFGGVVDPGTPSCQTTIITFFPPVSLVTCSGSVKGAKAAGWSFEVARDAITASGVDGTSIYVRDQFGTIQLQCLLPAAGLGSEYANFADALFDYRGFFSATVRSTSTTCENLRLVNGSKYRSYVDAPTSPFANICTTSGPTTTCASTMSFMRNNLPNNGYAEFEIRFDKSGASYNRNYQFRMQTASGLSSCEAHTSLRRTWTALLNADTGFVIDFASGICTLVQQYYVTSRYSVGAF